MFSQDFLSQIRLVVREELEARETAHPVQANEYLNAKEAAKYMKVSTWLLYNLTGQGAIPHVVVGKKAKRFLKSDLDFWLKSDQSNLQASLNEKSERKLEELRNKKRPANRKKGSNK